MPDSPLDERRFTDQEVREILKRAVEEAPETAGSSRAVTKGEGLSLAELKVIGAEVGIDAARLENAARAVVRGGRPRSRGLFGGPIMLDVEREVPGTIDPERAHEVLSVVRGIMGIRGQADEIGGAIEWSATSESGNRYVTVASREDSTIIQGSANLKNAVALTYLGPGMVGMIAAMIGIGEFANTGNELGMVVAFGLIALMFPIFRTVVNKISDREARKLNHVMDELARLAAPSSADEGHG